MSKYKGAPVLVIDTVKAQSVPLLTFNAQDYNAAEFVIQVKKNGETLPLTDTTARLYFHKPDKTTIFYDYPVTDAEAGEITVTLTTNALAASGAVTCELFLYDSNGDEIAVARKFKYIVERSLVNDEAVESSNEYQSLNRIIIDGEAAVEAANAAVINANIAVTNANEANSSATNAIEGATAAITNTNTAATNANNATSAANAAASIANTAAANADAAATAATNAKVAAETATTNANNAATNANTAASAANTAATDATNAKTTTETATANANTATTNANTAADSANTAATNANNATASITSFTNEVTNARTAKDGTVFPNVKAHTDSIHGAIDVLSRKTEWIDIRDYGAKSDAEQANFDSSQAIKDALSYAATLIGMGIKPKIKIPRGVFNVTNGVLSGFTSSSIIAGVTFEGENPYSSVLYLKTSGVTSYIYNNQTSAKLQNVLFDKLGFTSDDKSKGYAFRITSSGNEKQFSFRNCSFGNLVNLRVGKDTTAGGIAGIMALEGTANADLMKFVDCKLYCDEYVVYNNNPQSVAIELHGCDGVVNGDLFRFGTTPGGSHKVFGGAIDMYAHPTNQASYLVNCDDAGSHGVGNGDIVFNGTRVEIHGTNKGLVKSKKLTGGFTSVHFQGCNFAGSIDNTQIMVSITARKIVTFRDCNLHEKILYEVVGTISETSSPEHSGLIVIENCKVGASAATPLFDRFTIGEQGRVIAKGNTTQGSKAQGQVDVMDFDLGWQTALPRDPNVNKKVAVIIPSYANFPFVTTKTTLWKVKLPKGAMITKVYVSKPAQGSAVSNYQLYVGLADKSVIFGSSALAQQKLAHTIDVSPFYSTSATTEIALWVDDTNAGGEGNHKGIGFVEYI